MSILQNAVKAIAISVLVLWAGSALAMQIGQDEMTSMNQSPVEKRYNETDTATLETGLSLAAGVDVSVVASGKLPSTAMRPWSPGNLAANATSIPDADTLPTADITSTLMSESAWSVAMGADVFQTLRSQVDMGLTPYLELRYSGQHWKHWSAYFGATAHPGSESDTHSRTVSPRMGVELYETWFRDRLITGLGVVIAKPDQIVGTSMRYQIRFGWRLTPGWSLELVHESNCRAVCYNSLLSWMMPTDADQGFNRGYNFLVLRRQL